MLNHIAWFFMFIIQAKLFQFIFCMFYYLESDSNPITSLEIKSANQQHKFKLSKGVISKKFNILYIYLVNFELNY